MSIAKFLPGIAWFLFGLVLICLPGKDIPKSELFEFFNVDKMAHAGLFGGLVFLFCWPFKNAPLDRSEKINWFVRILIATCIWGITTELIQKYFIVGRQFDLLDWAADSFGAVLAYFVSRRFFAGSGKSAA